MINLLPNATRTNLSYARRNSLLLRWATALTIGLAGTILIVTFGEFYIHQQINSYKKDIATTQIQLKEQKLDQTQATVTQMSANIKLALQVLSKQVLFSDLIKQIGSAMPSGAALASLNISKLQGGIDLNAVAKNYKTASQIQLNLQDPKNQIFASADIQSITCTKAGVGDKRYPCQVTIRALFATNNPFLFIKKAGS